MYHCQIHFYFAGVPCSAFDIIKTITPYENFTHQYAQSEGICLKDAAEADVIVANLEGMEADSAAGKMPDGQYHGLFLRNQRFMGNANDGSRNPVPL